MAENVLTMCETVLKYGRVIQDIGSFPILGQTFLILETVLAIAQNADHNVRTCNVFRDRIVIAQHTLGKYKKEELEHNPALITYTKVLKDIEEFVKKITDAKGFKKYWKAMTVKEDAAGLLDRFDQAIQDLGLNTTADISKDISIINDDIKQMQKYMEMVQTGIVGLDGKLDTVTELVVRLQNSIKTGEVEQSVLASVSLKAETIKQDTAGFTDSAIASDLKTVVWNHQLAFQKDMGYVTDVELKEVEKDVAILKQLQACKNIITLYGVFKIDTRLHLLMEHAQYGYLYDHMQVNHSNMDWSLRYSIALGIVQGVCFMHEIGLLHHDLRAQNILLAEHYTPKITNFHSARPETEVSRPLRQGVNKIRWTPQERARNPRLRFNKRADVYNVGYLLWEIASGKIPFENDKEFDAIRKIMEGLRDPIPKDTPEKYAEIIKKAWAPDPLSRPTIIEIYMQLEAAYREFQGGNKKKKTAGVDELSDLIDEDGLLDLGDNTGPSIEDALKAHSSASYDIAYKIFQEIDTPKAHYYCGLYNYRGLGNLEVNLEAAAEHFRKAADGGNPDGQLRYGAALMKGDGAHRDVKLGFDYLCKAADNGNSAAQFNVGQIYWSGRINEIGVDRDAGKPYLILAAKAGHPHAKKLCIENDIEWD
ncbi:1830_t:CDS:2 [Paraglomus occultum]|uniref:1830_t:CDS:1 n=1 Tax=Paraglomus occultum TaxID=144539 RepID=A0A9N8ZVA9_9GLOM|nr:1830_t:CDS:2 [Paraglomus occultum]